MARADGSLLARISRIGVLAIVHCYPGGFDDPDLATADHAMAVPATRWV